MTDARGIRNNNPLNIRKSGSVWKGQVAGTDQAFVTFTSPEYGIRAAARILQTYQEKHAINTLAGVINRWAPPAENDTSAYVTAVSIWADIEPDEQLDLSDYETVLPLVRAMCRMECGKPPEGQDDWYPLDVWEQGLRLAGLSPAKRLTDSRTMKGTAVAGVASAAAGTTLLAQMLGLSPEIAALLPDALEGFTAQQVAWLTIGIAAAGNVYAAWARRDDKRKGRL